MLKIAVDGPAGAGKSTVAKAIAKKMGINYMDTGATYRAVAYALLKRNVDLKDKDKVKAMLDQIDITVVYTEEGQRVLCNGEDVTPYIRTSEVSKGASDVAVIPEVRLKLVDIQRRTAEQYDMIMDGRDIGTYVLPDAQAKFFITASPKIRAQRRWLELKEAGVEKNLEELEQEIIARDNTDSEREFAPLRQAEDALLVDTGEMTIEQVVAFLEEKIKEV